MFFFLDCPDSTEEVAAVSGKPLWLRPSNIQTKNVSTIQWKLTLQNSTGKIEILKHNKNQNTSFKSIKYDFNSSNFALGIKSAKLEDSGFYKLEITDCSGRICTKKFWILIIDRVENPDLQGEWKTQADGMCQLSLYCSVSKDDNVSFALYRGSKLISTQRNFTYLENQTDTSSLHTYTCNVSNKASWASDTRNFTQGCQSVPEKFAFLPLVVIIVILVLLFLCAVTCFCIRNKKRKQSRILARALTRLISRAILKIFTIRGRGVTCEVEACFLALTKEMKGKRNGAEKMKTGQKGHHRLYCTC
ncbi:Natural killer cell receptor 2B4 [Microtus ochrogaster]|uniref:Natural killer cell receptor 2B4 n=1 Tax=Microtus ochrogaster TaxID=79684 RepID=A0A8J6KJ13_MICOH|nr:Natural killer cell receptor 2B4 [Microtus ochrogaster]